jgi:RNA polymerase sigma-70 factor (ECF subfamily)
MTLRLAFSRQTDDDRPMSDSCPAPTDLELARRAASGEESAFDEIVLRKMTKVIAVAKRILRDEEDARDIAQLAFIRVWEKISTYDETFAFNTWLYRIVTNLAIDFLRSRGTRERTAQGFLHVVRLREEQEGPEVLLELERQEVERIFDRISGVLTERQRAVFVLKEIEELESREIAAVLDCGESTVRNHLFNARKLLRAEIVRLYPEYAGRLGRGEGGRR